MSRTLLLMRHAKAVDFASGRTDHQRALAEHGQHQARRVGTQLQESGPAPDFALCSTAMRTQQTLAGLGLSCPVDYQPSIYEARAETILEEIHLVPEGVSVLIVVGHAPGIPSLAHELADENSQTAALTDIAGGFPTATVCQFEVEQGWAELSSARLVRSMIAR